MGPERRPDNPSQSWCLKQAFHCENNYLRQSGWKYFLLDSCLNKMKILTKYLWYEFVHTINCILFDIWHQWWIMDILWLFSVLSKMRNWHCECWTNEMEEGRAPLFRPIKLLSPMIDDLLMLTRIIMVDTEHYRWHWWHKNKYWVVLLSELTTRALRNPQLC